MLCSPTQTRDKYSGRCNMITLPINSAVSSRTGSSVLCMSVLHVTASILSMVGVVTRQQLGLPSSLPIDGVTNLQTTLDRISSLTIRSTCFGAATRDLIRDCNDLASDLDDPAKGSYAIALTLCELSEAAVSGPKECKIVRGDYSLRACISALEKRPQWWTSFSGYYRDVTRMCHATRENGESKQMLELYRNITIVVEDLLSVLQRKLKSATNQYEEVIVENEAFVHSMSLWMKDHVSVSIEASQQYRHLVETEISDTMVILRNVTESQLDIFSDELSIRLADLQHHEMNAFRNVLNEEFVVFEKMLQHAKQDLMAYRNTIQDTTTAMDTLHMLGIHTAEQALDLQRVQEKVLVRATESLTNIEETATKLDKSVMLSSLSLMKTHEGIVNINSFIELALQDLATHNSSSHEILKQSRAMLEDISGEAARKLSEYGTSMEMMHQSLGNLFGLAKPLSGMLLLMFSGVSHRKSAIFMLIIIAVSSRNMPWTPLKDLLQCLYVAIAAILVELSSISRSQCGTIVFVLSLLVLACILMLRGVRDALQHDIIRSRYDKLQNRKSTFRGSVTSLPKHSARDDHADLQFINMTAQDFENSYNI